MDKGGSGLFSIEEEDESSGIVPDDDDESIHQGGSSQNKNQTKSTTDAESKDRIAVMMEESHENYSSDIASAVATILERAGADQSSSTEFHPITKKRKKQKKKKTKSKLVPPLLTKTLKPQPTSYYHLRNQDPLGGVGKGQSLHFTKQHPKGQGTKLVSTSAVLQPKTAKKVPTSARVAKTKPSAPGPMTETVRKESAIELPTSTPKISTAAMAEASMAEQVSDILRLDDLSELTLPGAMAEVEASITPHYSGQKQIPAPLPRNPSPSDVNLYIGRINTFINKLGYHHNGEPGIRVITNLSLRKHMETARQIVKSGENIKCLHALLLGIYFTNTTPLIERFSINFRSKFNGKEYRHVVLGIYTCGAYGAIGISRDPGLQEKPPNYSRLSDLLSDYVASYTESGHTLMEIKIGGIIPRDTTSQSGIPWKIGHVLYMAKMKNIQQFVSEVDKLARLLRVQMGPICIRQTRPSSEIGTTENSKLIGIESLPGPSGPSGSSILRDKIKLEFNDRNSHSNALTMAALRLSKAPIPNTLDLIHKLKPTMSTPPIKTKKKKVLKYKQYPEP